ncbi:hypothetical protein JW887_03865 [Candidatus Dojkabacteria bacterium]|nr:hypothetical protein [Candidatus Dojkabacteria bacterium]
MNVIFIKRLRASLIIGLITSLLAASIFVGDLNVNGSQLTFQETEINQSKNGYQDRQIAQLKAIKDEGSISPSWAIAVLYLKKLTAIDYGVAEANSILQNFELTWAGESTKVLVRSYFLFKEEPISLMYQDTKDHLRAELKKFTCSPPTQKDIDFIWYVNYPDGSGSVYPSGTENMKTYTAQLYLLANQEFKDESSVYQDNYEKWKIWWHKWFDEHAKKGWAEIASSYLYGFSLSSICNVYDFSDDPKIVLKAEMTIDWLLADHVIEQFNGIRGGGKVRFYTRRDLEWKREYFDYLFFGSHNEVYAAEDGEILATTSYRPSDVLIDLALSEDKGVYEVKERRPYSIYSMDQRWQARKYSYVTPDYILGGFQRGNSADGYIQESNDHLFGLIFSTTNDAFVFPWGKNYGIPQNQQGLYDDQVFQYKNVMIAKMGGATYWKYAEEEGYGDPNEAPTRCYFAYSVLDEMIEESGWIFIKEGNAYAAYRPVSGGYEWKDEVWWSDHYNTGTYVVANEPKIPAILEAALASEYSSFTAFRSDIKNRYLSISGETVKYEASDGKIIEVNFGDLYDGNNIKIDGQKQAAELESYKTFESPYINSDWNSGYIVISKDGKKCTLDFRDSDNPIKTCEIITDAIAPIISVNPPVIKVLEANASFLVNIIISDAVDILAWNIEVTWDPEILKITSVTEGDFLSSVGSTVFTAAAPPLLPNSNELYPGLIPDISSGLLIAESASGSGVLATLNFTSLSLGTCPILLGDTMLNFSAGELVIEHTVNDGQVIVIPEFQTWMLVPIFLMVSVIVVLTKKLRTYML